ncbi:MAG: hypothetical protein JO182_03495 [Acidobacteriaceae bacterium]|nr:hypothetical protein [Acidobacteriaceae bacterium]
MRRFKSPEQAQRFLEEHDILAPYFRLKQHFLSAAQYRVEREHRFQIWATIYLANTGFATMVSA